MVKWQHRGVRDPEIEHAGSLGSQGLIGADDPLWILSRLVVRTSDSLLQLSPRDHSDAFISFY
ncbi:hypothetical protein F511_09341 [Dorcoceras hygrometricum]|uniref:Uncharacterized protein n=1 Tax=Dorcoceras hygrometricum TaxID=472368 RepID=A0A2Z7C2C2_9LAMI|nr:hypothetical protein F511_09341 [Dorcoceras hygrometricum]